MNAKETLELLNKQWCDLDDIMKLAGIGKNKALEIRRQIKRKLIREGYLLPNNLLPMNKVIEEFKIDVEYLTKIIELNNNQ